MLWFYYQKNCKKTIISNYICISQAMLFVCAPCSETYSSESHSVCVWCACWGSNTPHFEIIIHFAFAQIEV